MLRLLSTARDPATRAAARSALPQADGAAREFERSARRCATTCGESGGRRRPWDRATRGEQSQNATLALDQTGPRLARCLVTPVDGRGRGSIVISVSQMAQRRTAAFLCDVQRGIRDVIGEVEPESPRAGSLLDEVNRQAGADCARDVPELALGLAGGKLDAVRAGGSPVGARLARWDARARVPAGRVPDDDPRSGPIVDSRRGVARRESALVLDACPSWLDASPLTFELAEEIWLREGRPAADPDRDAGAYRFLFEHRLIHRLELYRRMLLWMAWLWKCSGQMELSTSALALAVSALGRAIRRAVASLHRRAHDPKPQGGSDPSCVPQADPRSQSGGA